MEIALFAVAAAGGLWLAIVDAKTGRLPNSLMLPLYIAILGLTASMAITEFAPARYGWALIGGVALSLFYLLLGLGGGVGLGDVKLAGILGFYLAWYGWSAPIAATLLAYALAAPQALYVIIKRRRNPEIPKGVPFGPYMVAGALIVAGFALVTA